MKIAVYFNLPSGGAKRALYEQVKRLVKNHEVDVYTLNTANHDFCDLRPLVKNYHIYNLKYRRKFPLNLLSIYFLLPSIHQKIARNINKGGYDLAFVCHDFFTQSPYVLRYLDIPSVYFCQEPKREFYEHIPRINKKYTYHATLPLRLPLKNIDRRNISEATLVIVNSYYSQKLIENTYGIKAYVNYLGVDTKDFSPKNLEREEIVLSVGGFNLLKGHDFIIRSIGAIRKEKRPKFVIVGNGGEDEKYLKKLAHTLEVEIVMHQDVQDVELVSWYNKAKVFAYAPLHEPFGLAALEAIACGVPVVAVSEGGVGEILKKLSTPRIIKRDISEMSKNIVHMLNEKYNYSKIGKDIDYIRNTFSWEHSTSQLEKYFKTVCKK